MNTVYEKITELLFEARDSNPRRISKPGHPSQSTGAIGAAGPGSQKRAEKRFKHIKNMKEVEKKRATRAEKKAFKDHLLAIIRQSYGKVAEGKTTGGDMEATAERLGKWYASHGGPKGETEAKPGEKGYMRPRNVPPIDPKHPGSKYDPERHKTPKKEEPLEYKHPDHGSYARVHTAGLIGKIAGRKGRWSQNTYKKGMAKLRKHGKDKFSI